MEIVWVFKVAKESARCFWMHGMNTKLGRWLISKLLPSDLKPHQKGKKIKDWDDAKNKEVEEKTEKWTKFNDANEKQDGEMKAHREWKEMIKWRNNDCKEFRRPCHHVHRHHHDHHHHHHHHHRRRRHHHHHHRHRHHRHHHHHHHHHHHFSSANQTNFRGTKENAFAFSGVLVTCYDCLQASMNT